MAGQQCVSVQDQESGRGRGRASQRSVSSLPTLPRPDPAGFLPQGEAQGDHGADGGQGSAQELGSPRHVNQRAAHAAKLPPELAV